MRKALEDPPTKEKLLSAAQHLILEKGFVGTSVDDICAAARLTKGSFFHYFKSKDRLGVELLRKYCESSKTAFKTCCCPQEKDPLKRVYWFLDLMIKKARRKAATGCLLGCMAQELSDTHPEIRSISARGFPGMAEALKRDLAEAKARYKPKASVDPQGLADHFVAVLEGGMLVAKVRRTPGAMEANLKHFKQYLKGLFGR